MAEKLWDLAKENWLKYKSIPVVFILLCCAYWGIISSMHSWDGMILSITHYVIIAIPLLVVFIAYIIACFIHCRLPKAPKDTLAVLFVIDAESKRLFEDVQYKLVDNFKQSIISEDFSRFVALCVPREKVAKYQLKNGDHALKLLTKTNCIFLVTVRYTVDDINNAEDFELSINYGVRHPRFNNEARAVLSHDLYTLNVPVGKHRFAKKQTIDVFNFTTQALVYICQYILGFVYLLSGNINDSFELLSYVQKSLAIESSQTQGLDILKYLVNDRLFIVYTQIVLRYMANFKESKDPSYLYAMRDALNQANNIHPNTYFYNMNMAYSYIILERDTLKAKQCIEKCKQSKEDKAWLYSEAFLSAYSGETPSIIYSKYKRALKTPYPNLVEIVDYIEFVLDREPEKMGLHLAAGFIYEEINDAKLMKKHFSIFLDHLGGKDEKIEKIILSKMKAIDCGERCNADCSHCSRQNAA